MGSDCAARLFDNPLFLRAKSFVFKIVEEVPIVNIALSTALSLSLQNQSSCLSAKSIFCGRARSIAKACAWWGAGGGRRTHSLLALVI